MAMANMNLIGVFVIKLWFVQALDIMKTCVICMYHLGVYLLPIIVSPIRECTRGVGGTIV